MKEQDKRYVREELQEIETDLAFEFIEAYREQRSEDARNALATLRELLGVRRTLFASRK